MNNKYLSSLATLLLAAVVFVGCERDLSDDAEFATYATTAAVFTDSPVGLGSDFYLPYADAKASAFSIDNSVSYDGSSSIRFDVPNATDANGTYAGGIFRIDGSPRNLTGYDALTFWTKASQGITLGEVGFGEDYGENKYVTTLSNVAVGTTWQKVIIPIPDASKLTQELGMFRFAAGTQNTGGLGYTFWIDELKFENLGTIAQARPTIMGGVDASTDSFNGVTTSLTDLSATFSTANGDVTVSVAPSYFDFSSSNPAVALVNSLGVVSVNSEGTAKITAQLANTMADGSLTINSLGDFSGAPVPTVDAANVISIFSDAYTNVNVDFYNGYWEPYQTTESANLLIDGDNLLSYTNFNFVGTEFATPTQDASGKTYAHFDFFFPEGFSSNSSLTITLKDFGADGADGNGDDTLNAVTFTAADFVANSWVGLDVELPDVKTNMGQIIYEGQNISSFYVDNIYFY